MHGISTRLAKFASGEIAPSKRTCEIIRLSLADWAACGLAGVNEPVAKITRDMILAERGAGASVVFGGGVAPARAAALVNGATSHALDFDDTHFLHIGHPSVVIFPAVLAIAQERNLPGAQMMEAAALGFEASARIGAWLGRGHYEAGFHQTATAGSFGATLACGRLIGLTAVQMQYALGICATRASGLKSQFGTMGKPYNAGLAASNAIETVTLAALGFTSRLDGLECVQGFGDTHAGIADMSAFDDLGEVWVTESVSHKFHACCHGTHAALEALHLAAAGMRTDDAARVDIRTNPRWARVCNIAVATTGLEAKFSYRMTTAMALLGRDTGRADQFEDGFCVQADAMDMAAKVHVEFVGHIAETAAEVIVTDVHGRAHHAEFDLASPLPIAALEQRLDVKLSNLVGAGTAAKLAEAAREMQNAASVDELAALLAG